MSKGRAQFVRIVWYDACDARDTWCALDDPDVVEWMDELHTVISYGYLVKITKHYYVIAADLCTDMTLGRVTKVPKPWVLSIKQIPTLSYRGGKVR